jgi:hypothetical protein
VVRALAALALGLAALHAAACECFAVDPAKAPLGKYRAIFAGTVQSVKEVDVSSAGSSFRLKLVSFRVERVWKGARGVQRTVYTGLGGADCGIDFQPGRRYVVTAESGRSNPIARLDRPFASRCGLTAEGLGARTLSRRLDRELRPRKPAPDAR